MTPEAARLHAQAILVDHASVNASYVANGTIARAAELAALVIDLADQLEAVQTELVTLKRLVHDQGPRAVVVSASDRDADRDDAPERAVDLARRAGLPVGPDVT